MSEVDESGNPPETSTFNYDKLRNTVSNYSFKDKELLTDKNNGTWKPVIREALDVLDLLDTITADPDVKPTTDPPQTIWAQRQKLAKHLIFKSLSQ